MIRRAVVLSGLVVALAAPTSAAAARGLDLGFGDGVFSGADRDAWLQRAADSGAGIVRIEVGWPAPHGAARPAGFDATDPADPAYDFRAADAAVKAATAHGLQVLATFTGAPRWAEGAGRPDDASEGSWRPDPRALQDYGFALARRYSGGFPDPAEPGRELPRVRAFQPWNEPNLEKYLSPQWARRRPAAPAHYRRMLNAFGRGVLAAGSSALVVTAGTAPFGDALPGGRRMMPARFWRELLCLRGSWPLLRGARCPAPARFDVLAHHPYSVGTPRRGALNADDVSIPDLGKLGRLLRAAERRGRALGPRRHPLWATEISYDSSPPDPDGVPVARHARFLEQALYELWRDGVRTVIWFQVADQAPDPSFANTNQSGVFFRDGRAKPAQRAFRFPLVARRAGARQLQVWGRAPVAGRLQIERRAGGGWKPVRRLAVRAGATFVTHVVRKGEGRLRARVGDEVSLVWRAR